MPSFIWATPVKFIWTFLLFLYLVSLNFSSFTLLIIPEVSPPISPSIKAASSFLSVTHCLCPSVAASSCLSSNEAGDSSSFTSAQSGLYFLPTFWHISLCNKCQRTCLFTRDIRTLIQWPDRFILTIMCSSSVYCSVGRTHPCTRPLCLPSCIKHWQIFWGWRVLDLKLSEV